MNSHLRRSPTSSASADEERRQEAPELACPPPTEHSSSVNYYYHAATAPPPPPSGGYPHQQHQQRASPPSSSAHRQHLLYQQQLQQQPGAHYHGSVPRPSPPHPPTSSSRMHPHITTNNQHYDDHPLSAAVTPSPYQHQQRYRFPIPSYLYSSDEAEGTAPTTPAPSKAAIAGCTCKKSRCLKLYCQCFAGSTTCGPTCRCDDCHNLPQFAVTIDEARRSICNRRPLAFDRKQVQQQVQDREQGSTASVPSSALASISRVGCKCRRSNCLKKYCECYAASSYCSDKHCKCLNCGNTGANANRDHRKPEPPTPQQHMEQQYRRQSLFFPAGTMTPSAHHPPLHRQMQLMPHARPVSQQNSGTMQAQCQRPQEKGDHPRLNEERLLESVSQYRDMVQPKPSPRSTPRASPSTNEVDAEAIMAAVAMTELFNSGSRESATPTTELTASFAKTEIDKIKRKPLEHGKNETNKKPKFSSSPRSPDDDDIRTAVSASRSFTSVESRNPPSPGIHLPPRSSPPYQATVPARYPPPPHQWISGPPPPPQFHMMGPRFAPREPPQGYRLIPVKMAYRVSPPPPFYSPSPPLVGAAAAAADNFPPQQQQQQQQSELEDRTGASLPRALSFRKICSHCGKTRGEHGELGFGHKCQYRDCGKCGAAQHWHEAVGQRMGVECRLSVGQGAVPGAVATYDRKLQELAVRAELQREMRHQHKQDQQQRPTKAAGKDAASSVVANTTVAAVQ